MGSLILEHGVEETDEVKSWEVMRASRNSSTLRLLCELGKHHL